MSGRPWHRSVTAWRLLLGFGALVVLLALVSAASLRAVVALRASFEAAAVPEEGAVLASELASAVRDQYAHQAHTIIIGDESHLGFYGEAQARVARLARAVRAQAATPEARAAVADIEAGSQELDRIFRERIVPAVLRGDRALVVEEHGRAQLMVNRIQGDADRLTGAFRAAIAAQRSEARRMEAAATAQVVALLVAAPLLALVVALAIGRSVARPLARLEAGTARLAAGELGARVGWAGRDEFAALARRFDAMAAAIQEREARIVEAEKLASLGRLAAGVAHEINDPLAVILGYVRLLRKRADAGLDEDLAVLEEEALRCKEIVDGLLDLARPPRLLPERVDLRALADGVVARAAEARVLGGAQVAVTGQGTAQGDPAKLRQVLANLVRNAAEAAGAGRVEVRVAVGPAGAEVAVHDAGPGLDADARARLFEPFFTTKPRGTGLGLAVSRSIARAHGGDLEAGASPLGGAAFTLRWPAGPEGTP